MRNFWVSFKVLGVPVTLLLMVGCGASSSLTTDASGRKAAVTFANNSGTKTLPPSDENSPSTEPAQPSENVDPNAAQNPPVTDTSGATNPGVTDTPVATNPSTIVNPPSPDVQNPEAPKPDAQQPSVVEPPPVVTEPVLPKVETVFTSNLLKQIFETKASVNALPYWYGFRWNRSIHDAVDEWTEFLYNEIDKNAPAMTDGNLGDIQKFCPKFPELDREKKILFWMRFVSVLASKESGFRAKAANEEPAIVGESVISTGLFQLSVVSVWQKRFNCDSITRGDRAKAQEDLLDPKKNIACAIKVMNHYLEYDKVIAGRGFDEKGYGVWMGLARYWLPFRNPHFKTGPDAYFTEMDIRREKWQSDSRDRDQKFAEKGGLYRTAGKVWQMTDWEYMHPSLFDARFEKEEPNDLTRILRLSNQTSFCF
ncbi:MAG: transglycosylase SLT domain-containing protein [Bdellovibrionota bacterium]